MDCIVHRPIYFDCDHTRYNFWRESSFHTKGDLSIYEYIKMIAANFTCCAITVDACEQKVYKNYFVPKSKFIKQNDMFSARSNFDWKKAVKHVLNCECGVAFPEDPFCCGCTKDQDKLKILYLPKFPTKQKKSKNWINLNLVIHNILQTELGTCSSPNLFNC